MISYNWIIRVIYQKIIRINEAHIRGFIKFSYTPDAITF